MGTTLRVKLKACLNLVQQPSLEWHYKTVWTCSILGFGFFHTRAKQRCRLDHNNSMQYRNIWIFNIRKVDLLWKNTASRKSGEIEYLGILWYTWHAPNGIQETQTPTLAFCTVKVEKKNPLTLWKEIRPPPLSRPPCIMGLLLLGSDELKFSATMEPSNPWCWAKK